MSVLHVSVRSSAFERAIAFLPTHTNSVLLFEPQKRRLFRALSTTSALSASHSVSLTSDHISPPRRVPFVLASALARFTANFLVAHRVSVSESPSAITRERSCCLCLLSGRLASRAFISSSQNLIVAQKISFVSTALAARPSSVVRSAFFRKLCCALNRASECFSQIYTPKPCLTVTKHNPTSNIISA